jgi:hypothetical protein
VLSARPTVFLVGGGFRGLGPVGTVVLVLLAVAPAAMVLSTIPPGVVKLRLRTLAETGQTVGRLSALGTLGALAGTFLTGFVLLSAFATSTLLLLTGAILVVTGVVVAVVLPEVVDPTPLVAIAGLAVLSGGWLIAADSTCDVETRYYCAEVVADPEREGGRTLVLDGLRHSYVDLDDPAHLEFPYTQRIADVLTEQRQARWTCCTSAAAASRCRATSRPRVRAAAAPCSRSTRRSRRSDGSPSAWSPVRTSRSRWATPAR